MSSHQPGFFGLGKGEEFSLLDHRDGSHFRRGKRRRVVAELLEALLEKHPDETVLEDGGQ